MAVNRTKRATIHDVAKKAEVAVGTVSRYLNGQGIRSCNRERIEKAIEAVSFRRNAAAAAIRQNHSQFVGFLVPQYDEFHARLLEQVIAHLRNIDLAVIPFSHGDHESTLSEALNFFSEQGVGAMIMSGDLSYHVQKKKIVESNLPVVLYNNDIRGLLVDRVLVDNFSAARSAVRHLVDLGHMRIATLAGRLGDSSSDEREAGYRKALEEAGIPFRNRYFVRGDWHLHGGYVGAQKLMGSAEPPTAILSANYLMTFGALEWIKQNNIDYPHDISLISFDDCQLFHLLDRGVTAIAQPVDRIAQSIVGLVHSRNNDPEAADIRKVILGCDLIYRGSTSKPKNE